MRAPQTGFSAAFSRLETSIISYLCEIWSTMFAIDEHKQITGKTANGASLLCPVLGHSVKPPSFVARIAHTHLRRTAVCLTYLRRFVFFPGSFRHGRSLPTRRSLNGNRVGGHGKLSALKTRAAPLRIVAYAQSQTYLDVPFKERMLDDRTGKKYL